MRLTLAHQTGTIEFPREAPAGDASGGDSSGAPPSDVVARMPPRRPHGIDYNQLAQLVASCPHLTFLHGVLRHEEMRGSQ